MRSSSSARAAVELRQLRAFQLGQQRLAAGADVRGQDRPAAVADVQYLR
ncbi:hypothetical protein [Bounagaea algeriensis]